MMAPFKVGPFAFFHHYCQLLQWQSLSRDLMANLSHFYITEGCVVVLLGKTAKNNIGPGWTTKPVTSYEPNQLMRKVPVKTWTLLKKKSSFTFREDGQSLWVPSRSAWSACKERRDWRRKWKEGSFSCCTLSGNIYQVNSERVKS